MCPSTVKHSKPFTLMLSTTLLWLFTRGMCNTDNNNKMLHADNPLRYAFGENKEMLKKAMSFLNPGGSFAIIVQEHQAIAHALTLFNESLDYHNVTASEFAKWLTQNGYPSTKCVRLSHWIPSDTFLSASGALNQSGADYASFLVARPYTALPESKQGLLSFFNSIFDFLFRIFSCFLFMTI